jgi:D-alanine-D-alanine ligase
MDSNSPLLNLVVIYGGQSAEHDVSCVTAAHVLKAVDPKKYKTTAIAISRDGHRQRFLLLAPTRW